MRPDLIDLVELLTALATVRGAQATHPELNELAQVRAELVQEIKARLLPPVR